MKVLIAGSRGYPHRLAVREYIRTLAPGTVLVTGGAIGVDTTAQQEALAQGLPCEVHKALWSRYGRAAGPKRNKAMVEASDRVVAFWDEQSAGTLSTIHHAQRAGKPLIVFGVDGSELSPDAY